MTRGELKAGGVRIDRMLSVAVLIWLLTVAAAYGSWQLSTPAATEINEQTLLPLGVVLTGFGFIVRAVWRVATERKSLLDRLKREEQSNRRAHARIDHLEHLLTSPSEALEPEDNS